MIASNFLSLSIKNLLSESLLDKPPRTNVLLSRGIVNTFLKVFYKLLIN